MLPKKTSSIPSQFLSFGVDKRGLVVALSQSPSHRTVFGIIGDYGPAKEIGEANIAMNRALNGLPDNDQPKHRQDAINRFQAKRSAILLFPGSDFVLARPISGARISAAGADALTKFGDARKYRLYPYRDRSAFLIDWRNEMWSFDRIGLAFLAFPFVAVSAKGVIAQSCTSLTDDTPRDPAVVAFQVRYWEADVLSNARNHAKTLGLAEEGIFLMAFYESNPGQVPALKTAIRQKKPPETLRAGGRNWRWDGSDRPSALAGVTLDRWHILLIWQAMCRAPNETFRIRNRNLKFFSEYLAEDFVVPKETEPGMPSAKEPNNCDPTRVKLRGKVGG